MSSCKFGYVFGVVFLAIALTLPPAFLVVEFATHWIRGKQMPLPPLPGFGGDISGANRISARTFCGDRFVEFRHVIYHGQVPDPRHEWRFSAIDPETNQEELWTIDPPLELADTRSLQLYAFDDRLFLYGQGTRLVNSTTLGIVSQQTYVSAPPVHPEAWEVVDRSLLPTSISGPPWDPRALPQFMLDGIPTFLEFSEGWFLSRFKDGAWQKAMVVLPNENPTGDIKSQPGAMIVEPQLWTSHHGKLHVFVTEYDFATGNDRWWYREGIELRPLSNSGTSPNSNASVETIDSRPASALTPSRPDDTSAGWKLVDQIDSDRNRRDRSNIYHESASAGSIAGQPALFIPKNSNPRSLDGRLYQFDGQKWFRRELPTFPFGTKRIHLERSPDWQKSYLNVTTSVGWRYVYRVDADRISLVMTEPPELRYQMGWMIGEYTKVPKFGIVSGIALGVAVWGLMRFYTRPDYGFGIQNIKLASLGRRGLARLIDLGFIAGSTFGLGWFLTFGFDWLAFAEAMNLNIDHPAIHSAGRIIQALGIWLVLVIVGIIVVQGICGRTPGKWCCGLRTLRTTLKPCGFSRSLVREVVMCVDVCNFLCWTPGIVCIAFTKCRQRFGDLVADTIVVVEVTRPIRVENNRR